MAAVLASVLRTTAATVARRIEPVISALAQRLASAAAIVVERTAPARSWLAERTAPARSWLAERLEPWTALLKDLAAVVATAAVNLLHPVVYKLTERLGIRLTVISAATALFVGSAGSAAWAINALDEPAIGETSAVTAAAEIALSKDAEEAASAQISAQQQEEAAAKAAAEAQAAQEAAEAEAAEPERVGGLSEMQFANAIAIVEEGDEQGLDRKAWAIALATAMQESKFRNYANVNVPESYDFEFQAEGSDHDSVGLFQQRPSSGWGSVEELMDPKTSASKFYKSLKKVDGWEDMPVTKAAQTVQVSAFPDAYAQWEDLAWEIVKSYEAANS